MAASTTPDPDPGTPTVPSDETPTETDEVPADDTKPVPYDRFKEVNDRFRMAERERDNLQQQLADPELQAALNVISLLKTSPEKALAEWMGCEVIYEEQPTTKDGETITNESGGKQSFISARFDCIPPVVLRLLAQCLGFGARKYGKENWKKIPIEDNIAHAQNHLNEWMFGDRSEPHLVNAMARVSFALWQAVDAGQQADTYVHPDNASKP
jgi:hypothetical protein